MEGENENFLIGCPNVITYECTKKIMEQMEKYICKIKIGQNQGTGFFCKIPFPGINNMLTVFITNNHIIDQEFLNKEDAIIQFDIKEETDKININLNNRMKYTSEEYDTTIIEIKEKDNIKNYLELDDIIINDIIKNQNKNKEYEDKTIYIIQYPNGELSVSYGVFLKIYENENYNFNHNCSTQKGSSGSPILTLNNKVFGIHKKAGNKNYNKGGFLSFPIKEFIKLNYHPVNNNIEKEIINTNLNYSINDSINNTLNYQDDVQRIGQTLILIGSGKYKIIDSLKGDYYDDYPLELSFFYQIIDLKNLSIELRIQEIEIDSKETLKKDIHNQKSLLILLIYDSCSRKSFNNLSDWILFIYSLIKPKIVICCYNDNSKKREVSRKEGESFAKKYGLSYQEFNDENIKEIFYNCIAELPIFEEKMSNMNKVQLAEELFEKNK